MNINLMRSFAVTLFLGVNALALGSGCSRVNTQQDPDQAQAVGANSSEWSKQTFTSAGKRVQGDAAISQDQLPAEAQAVLKVELDQRFIVTPEKRFYVTHCKDWGFGWEFTGTATNISSNIVIRGPEAGVAFHHFRYQATKRPILAAEQLDNISQAYDIVFQADAAAYVSLGEEKEKRYISWWRNVTSEHLDFPVCSVICRNGEWRVLWGHGADVFDNQFEYQDISELK